jgi:hypothetical protein
VTSVQVLDASDVADVRDVVGRRSRSALHTTVVREETQSRPADGTALEAVVEAFVATSPGGVNDGTV